MMVTVLTVDDQPVFLRAARDLISATPGFEHVGQATSGSEALELAATLSPDLVLLDVRMPDMDGLETARRLHAVNPEAVVVLVSMGDVPELSAEPSPGVATHLRKQALSARALRDVWAAHGSGHGQR
jgi:two-component system, NarL family, invasion response regulator UvrY